MASYETIVIGGGLVGSAIGYGLARHGQRVLLLDEGDVAFRASRGNFGLVWVQGKGVGLPAYASWTRRSADHWPELAADLRDHAGIDVELAQPGGVRFCFSDEEMAERERIMRGLANAAGPGYRFEMLDRHATRELSPHLGSGVVGACYCPHDGHVNPLRLLQALHKRLQQEGGSYRPGQRVESISSTRPGFAVRTAQDEHSAGQVVLTAGTGTPALAAMVGLDIPVRPQRGQILVTAKVRPFLPLPTHLIRQTADGGVMMGDSKEEVGFDDSTTPRVMTAIARNAVKTFPLLAGVPVVRSWGALRVMTPDGHPIYQASESCPGAYAVCVHSGVTLAAAHAGPLAEALAEGGLPEILEPFSTERFDVQSAA